MKKRPADVPANGTERFEYLARRLFAVSRREINEERALEDARKKALSAAQDDTPSRLRRFAMSIYGTKEELRCSFCGRTADEVTYLMAGGAAPRAYICDACVDAAAKIVEKNRQTSPSPAA